MYRSSAAELHKQRILDVVNQLNEEELEKVSELLRASEQEKLDAVKADQELDEKEALQEVASQSLAAVEDELASLERDRFSSVSGGAVSGMSKVVISKLRSQLEEEKAAREKLQNELQDLQV